MKLLNAFSVQMLGEMKEDDAVQVRFHRVTLEEVKKRLCNGLESAIGHQDTATVLTSMLGMEVKVNRVSVTLQEAIVAQYKGTRLPEGATTLPLGGEFQFFVVQPDFHRLP